LKAAADPDAIAMPMLPKTNGVNGTQPGAASTIPTIAVNTMSSVTLGLVSSK